MVKQSEKRETIFLELLMEISSKSPLVIPDNFSVIDYIQWTSFLSSSLARVTLWCNENHFE